MAYADPLPPYRPQARTGLLVFLAVAHFLLASGNASAVVSRAEHSRDCVMCHIEWGDGYERLEPLLAPPSHRVLIDGQPARNSSEEMCWSCHDAYVCDDRDAFLDHDPHLERLADGARTGTLPLDLDGRVYCGTCHTPHSHTMGRTFEMSPFLRGDYLSSQLCLNCHADRAGAGSHPLHQPLADGRGGSLSSAFAPANRVECLSCHQMHKHQATRLGVEGDRTPLCAACHTPQLQVRETRHRPAAGQADACSSCHAVHGGGRAAGDNEGCLACHGNDPRHDGGGGHPLGIGPAAVDGLPLRQGRIACGTCHDPHRWSALNEVDKGQEGTPATSFLRRPDQAEAGLCQGCHPREAAILASDHGAAETRFAPQAVGTVWRCSSCHDAHGAEVLRTLAAPPDAGETLSRATRLCLACHQDSGEHGVATAVGRYSHPVGKGIGALRPVWLPRREGEGIGCETCHDPHQWSPADAAWSRGADGDEGSSFLRADNRQGGLCLDCHDRQAAVLGSLHDRRGGDGVLTNACAACHRPHRAASASLLGLLAAAPGADRPETSLSWPEGSRERLPSSWTEGAAACLACHGDASAGQRVPQAWAHPTWETGAGPGFVPEEDPDQQVDCRSCHDPHRPWREGRQEGRVQFLTAESSETRCATCHGDETLWRYNYYHDPARRHP